MVTEIGDRRIAPRAQFTGITIIRLGDEEVTSTAGNISESGMLLYPWGKAQNASCPLRLTFALPRREGWITLEARLVHESRIKSRRAWGVAFIDPPPPVKEAVRAFVSDQLMASPSAPAPVPAARPCRPTPPEPLIRPRGLVPREESTPSAKTPTNLSTLEDTTARRLR